MPRADLTRCEFSNLTRCAAESGKQWFVPLHGLPSILRLGEIVLGFSASVRFGDNACIPRTATGRRDNCSGNLRRRGEEGVPGTRSRFAACTGRQLRHARSIGADRDGPDAHQRTHHCANVA